MAGLRDGKKNKQVSKTNRRKLDMKAVCLRNRSPHISWICSTVKETDKWLGKKNQHQNEMVAKISNLHSRNLKCLNKGSINFPAVIHILSERYSFANYKKKKELITRTLCFYKKNLKQLKSYDKICFPTCSGVPSGHFHSRLVKKKKSYTAK